MFRCIVASSDEDSTLPPEKCVVKIDVKTANDLFGAIGLLGSPRRILIVEDHLPWLLSLSVTLEELGHSVVPMVGVLEVSQTAILGLGKDGSIVEPPTCLQEIEAVFLDYNFAGGRHNGATFLREFRLYSQSPVIGMSSDRTCNATLSRLGATVSLQKHLLKNLLARTE